MKKVLPEIGLVVLYGVASVLNFTAWLKGFDAHPEGFVATLCALLAWPVYGAWVGGREPTRASSGWRFPLIFWSLVAIAHGAGLGILNASDGETVSSGGGQLLAGLVLFASGSAPYGLTYAFPGVDSKSLAVYFGTCVAMLVLTLASWAVSRRVSPDGRSLRRT